MKVSAAFISSCSPGPSIVDDLELILLIDKSDCVNWDPGCFSKIGEKFAKCAQVLLKKAAEFTSSALPAPYNVIVLLNEVQMPDFVSIMI